VSDDDGLLRTMGRVGAEITPGSRAHLRCCWSHAGLSQRRPAIVTSLCVAPVNPHLPVEGGRVPDDTLPAHDLREFDVVDTAARCRSAATPSHEVYVGGHVDALKQFASGRVWAAVPQPAQRACHTTSPVSEVPDHPYSQCKGLTATS